VTDLNKKGSKMKNVKRENIIYNLSKAQETFLERSNYGSTYNQYGDVLKALFPKGLPKGVLSDLEEMNRFGNLTMIVHKLMRYCNQWDDKHKDSIHDLGVYAFIQEGIDDSTKD
tara:strand:+ start:5876 stop:6217 length:342 start_codon:yes stop_codon:yes gene_type:complete